MEINGSIAAELDIVHRLAKEAFLRKDLAAYLDIFADELKYQQPDGKVISKARLEQDISRQMVAMGAVESSYERLSLAVDGEQVLEMLSQTGFFELVAFGLLRRKWSLFRRGNYIWRKLDGWKIVRVEVLEEKVTPAGIRFGLK